MLWSAVARAQALNAGHAPPQRRPCSSYYNTWARGHHYTLEYKRGSVCEGHLYTSSALALSAVAPPPDGPLVLGFRSSGAM